MSWLERFRPRTPPRGAAFGLTLVDELPALVSGMPAHLVVRVHNTGTLGAPDRPSAPPEIHYRWLTPSGIIVARGDDHTPVDPDVAPGASGDFRVAVDPPHSTGRFDLEIDVRCGEAGQLSPLRIPCTVERGEMEAFDDYLAAWDRADLERDFWSIVGPGTHDEFLALGRHKLQLLLDRGLTPSSRVLDVGCGTGCLTVQLQDYLGTDAVYYGADIAEKAVAFCRTRYTRDNFRFLVNRQTEVVIPDLAFDFITLYSVFTHMYPDEIRLLLTSLGALLAPGGGIVADAFVTQGGPAFSGSRAKVDIAAETLAACFDDTGFCNREAETLVQEGDVLRQLYWLRR